MRVIVYDTLDEMRQAGQRFNGNDLADALGVTQAHTDEDDRATAVTIRLTSGYLTTRIVMHEVHHAATALYGAAAPKRPSRRAHLNHYNEPAAHLFSDLANGLVKRLYDLGYYD